MSMVYGFIDRHSRRFYTHLKDVFNALDNRQRDYNWLITNYACYPLSANNRELFSGDPVVISGEELMKALEDDNSQWVWGVFSAIKKDYEKQDILSAALPYDDTFTCRSRNNIGCCVYLLYW